MTPSSAPGHPNRPFALETAGDVHDGPIEFEATAIRAEADGYDGIGATELQHDPFISLAVAARSTTTIELGSSIAVAFARNPMSVAESANDLLDLKINDLADDATSTPVAANLKGK